MRSILFIILVCSYCSCIAQTNDFPDYRSKKENFTKMQEKDIRNDVASFAFAAIEESIGKLPLKTIPVTDFGKKFMKFEGNQIKVIVTAGTFDKTKHKLTYYDEKHLVKINNKPFYGSYGKVPSTTIESVIVIINNDTVPVPPAALADLYNPSYSYTDASGVARSQNRVYLSPDNRKIYIYMLNREASGSYEVTWVIQDKKYLRRVVDFGLLK